VDRHPAAVTIVRTYLQPLVDLSSRSCGMASAGGSSGTTSTRSSSRSTAGARRVIYFVARDLLAPIAKPTDARDVARFTTTLLQMGNRALAGNGRRTPAARHAS
jgi:hypothetical protein